LHNYVIKYTKKYGGLMMFNKRSFYCFFIAMIVLSFGILTGCAKPPAEEMAKADKAYEEAKQKEAPVYVPGLFAKADESLKKAKSLVEEKKYKEAKQAAIEAETAAQQAVAGIDAAKAKMKSENEKSFQDLQKAMDDLKATVSTAAKKKALAKAMEEAQGMVSKWETDLAGIKEKLQSPKVKEVGDEIKGLNDMLKAKNDEITSLISPPATTPAAPAALPAKNPAAPAPLPKK
jgi:hypothetical protein